MQWNYIDCIVVLGGYFSLLPGVGNVSAIRIIRVLRPLRTLNRVKKLRVIVLTLLGSMKQLANVGVLIMFLFTIYSIVGIQVRADRFVGCCRCCVARFECFSCGCSVVSCLYAPARQLLSGSLHNRCGNATAPMPWSEFDLQQDNIMLVCTADDNTTCEADYTCGYGCVPRGCRRADVSRHKLS